MKIKYSLRTKISLAFFAMALVLFLFISLTAHYFLQNGFKDYTINKLQDESKSVVAQLSSKYTSADGKWDTKGIESIGLSAMEKGLIIKLLNTDSAVIWDARIANNGYCNMMLNHMEMNMQEQNPNFIGAYVEKSYALISGEQNIGTVMIGYYGPYFYSDSDMKFLATLDKVLLGAGILALLLSAGLGAVLASRLSRPIKQVIEQSKRIARGEFETKISTNSSTSEIVELTETINCLAETLGRQESLRKRLSADIAHELRTPIATLQSHLELMLAGIWQADQARLAGLQEEAIRLGKLVGDLNKIAQVESENLVLQRAEFDLNQVGKSVVNLVESEFFKAQIELIYQGESALMVGDQDKIKQVFLNLLTNALCYTGTGGKVEVTVTNSTAKIVVQIKDNGIGIPVEDLGNIFARFYRVDKARSRNSGGTGIGLAITKAFVEAHGGTITVSSKEGFGSCFTFELPKTII
ncbi:MAG: ATP-binding protein [Clostridia bacterium]